MSEGVAVISKEPKPQLKASPLSKAPGIPETSKTKHSVTELPNIGLTQDQFREAQRKLWASEDLANKLNRPSKEKTEILTLREQITINLSQYRPQYCSVIYGNSLMLQWFEEKVVRFVRKNDSGKTESLRMSGEEFLLNACLFDSRISAETLESPTDNQLLTTVPLINVTTEGAKEIVSYSGLLVFQEARSTASAGVKEPSG